MLWIHTEQDKDVWEGHGMSGNDTPITQIPALSESVTFTHNTVISDIYTGQV